MKKQSQTHVLVMVLQISNNMKRLEVRLKVAVVQLWFKFEYTGHYVGKRQFGNLARHSWGTVEAQLGHSWGTKSKTLGHSWGTAGAQLGHSWGTVGAQLGHKATWGTVGTQLRYIWGTHFSWARLGQG